MTEVDDIAELMSEPPNGHNFGRCKGDGGWQPLETVDWGSHVEASPSVKRPVDPRKHGTIYPYVKRGCRCAPCRAAWAAYLKLRRRDG